VDNHHHSGNITQVRSEPIYIAIQIHKVQLLNFKLKIRETILAYFFDVSILVYLFSVVVKAWENYQHSCKVVPSQDIRLVCKLELIALLMSVSVNNSYTVVLWFQWKQKLIIVESRNRFLVTSWKAPPEILVCCWYNFVVGFNVKATKWIIIISVQQKTMICINMCKLFSTDSHKRRLFECSKCKPNLNEERGWGRFEKTVSETGSAGRVSLTKRGPPPPPPPPACSYGSAGLSHEVVGASSFAK